MSAGLSTIKRKNKKIVRAEQCIELQKAKLKCKIPSFSYVLSQLKAIPVREEIFLCTDGNKLFYNPKQIIEEKEGNVEEVLCHIVLHGLFGHFEESPVPYQSVKIANIVKDIQVAYAMEVLHPKFAMDKNQKKSLNFLLKDKKERMVFGNELYYAALKDRGICVRLYQVGKKFQKEDHSFWMKCKMQVCESGQEGNIWENARKMLFGMKGIGEEKTQCIGAYTRSVMEGLTGKRYGTGRVNREWQISEEESSKTAYNVLLEQLTSITEVNKEEDEIDKALYMYGLELYGDVPLLEPMECTQKKHLNTMVIALDTSGSCTARIASFLKEVRKLFEDIRGEFEVECIYLLQCDNEINKEQVYYDLSAFSEEVKNFKIIGGGGTSFVPVFKRVEEIQLRRKVDILFYLTDACGEYPEGKGPAYPVCFLMPPEEVKGYEEGTFAELIPEWVKKYPIIMTEN